MSSQEKTTLRKEEQVQKHRGPNQIHVRNQIEPNSLKKN